MSGDTSRSDALDAKALIQIFSDAGYSPQKLAPMLDGRVSYRALYRWKNGEAKPQRLADFLAVLDLGAALGIITKDQRNESEAALRATYIEADGPDLSDEENPDKDELSEDANTEREEGSQ
jgi:hypothetical protein